MTKKHPIRPHLKAWRKFMKKTQVWVANEIGTTHSNYLRQEKGETGVDDATFEAIARAYGITVVELLAHPDDAEKARALNRLLNAVRHLDSEALAVVAGFAERIKITA